MRNLIVAAAVAATPFTFAVAAPVMFTGAYSQDFDALGPTGTTLTTLGVGEWTSWRINPPGSSNGTWTNATGVIAADLSQGTLINDTAGGSSGLGLFYNPSVPTFTRVGGVNAGGTLDPNDPDRSLGTSPTGFAGNASQLALTNNTGFTLNSLSLAYDTTTLSVAANQELPGYRFFYSLTGATGTWIAAAALDTITSSGDPRFTTRNTAGAFGLTGGWAAGSSLLLRFVDDNNVTTSPDQMLAIDNVAVIAPLVAPIPEPATWAMMMLGFGLVGAAVRRRRGSALA